MDEGDASDLSDLDLQDIDTAGLEKQVIPTAPPDSGVVTVRAVADCRR